jgi:hypothetical protein
VIAAAILTLAVTVSTSMFEANKARKDTAEQAAKTERILSEINRGLRPITRLVVTFNVEFPALDPLETKYRARLERIARERFNQPQNAIPQIPGVTVIGQAPALSFQIARKSDLWPQGGEASALRQLVGVFTSSVEFLRKPVSDEEAKKIEGSDFGAIAFSEDETTLTWDAKSKRLFTTIKFTFDPDYWRKNGRITSIIDLRGAQIFLLPPQAGNSLAGTKIDYVRFVLGDGEDISLRGDQLKVSSYGSSQYFMAVFPSEEEDFRKFTGHTMGW